MTVPLSYFLDIANSEACGRGADRLLAARGSVRDAFGGLGLGWTYDDVDAFLRGSQSYQAMLQKLGADWDGPLQGIIMAFAIVAVEQSRLMSGGLWCSPGRPATGEQP